MRISDWSSDVCSSDLVDDALMCADWLPLGDDLEAIGIDAQADSAIGERGRYAIAIALKVDETGRRYPFAIFHKTIEGPARNHQTLRFIGPGIGNRSGFDKIGRASCRERGCQYV